MSKYRVPIEYTKTRHRFFGYTVYEYKLYADDDQKKFGSMKFVDVDGFMVGFHLPVEFTSNYVKKADQVRSSAKKVIDDARSVAGISAIAAVNVGAELKSDASRFAKQTGARTATMFGKLKGYLKKKEEEETAPPEKEIEHDDQASSL